MHNGRRKDVPYDEYVKNYEIDLMKGHVKMLNVFCAVYGFHVWSLNGNEHPEALWSLIGEEMCLTMSMWKTENWSH